MNESQARLIAFYLPQFHPIPENDLWWKKGFTEWMNVGKAKVLFPGHYQPKVPADLGYYDLRVPETRKAQAEMAREYGIEGFCYWHYWFGNGRRLLERPFNEVLSSGEPDFPFCLAWANESWRGFYHGIKTKETFIEQKYFGIEDHRAHFEAVLPAFKDSRYIKVEGKPLFMIYKPFDNKGEVASLMSLWQELAVKNGLKGIYFVAQTYHLKNQEAEIRQMGFSAINPVRLFDYRKRDLWQKVVSKVFHNLFGLPYVVSYRRIMKYFVTDAEKQQDIYPTLIPNWDHSPRSGRQGVVAHRSEPEYFEEHMRKVMSTIEHKPDQHKIVFVKSWNEWAEGNYLEPDLKYGMRYLEIIRKCILKK